MWSGMICERLNSSLQIISNQSPFLLGTLRCPTRNIEASLIHHPYLLVPQRGIGDFTSEYQTEHSTVRTNLCRLKMWLVTDERQKWWVSSHIHSVSLLSTMEKSGVGDNDDSGPADPSVLRASIKSPPQLWWEVVESPELVLKFRTRANSTIVYLKRYECDVKSLTYLWTTTIACRLVFMGVARFTLVRTTVVACFLKVLCRYLCHIAPLLYLERRSPFLMHRSWHLSEISFSRPLGIVSAVPSQTVRHLWIVH